MPRELRIRPVLHHLKPQGISEISEYGADFDGVIPMWFGESDLVTPEAPRRALIESLESGKTFYQAQNGLPALRDAIAAYDTRLHDKPVAADRITVTASGMTALHVALQTIVDDGENIVLVTPIWPNAPAAMQIMGAEPRRVSLVSQPDGKWQLDLDRLFDACDDKTRGIFVNSPNNPTGWMCCRDEQQAILDFARERGIWILADEVYHRITYGRETAPSFLDLAKPDDPVLAINSFSKSWAMTGWRLGWLTAPPALYDTLGLMVQYTNSNSPEFIQDAGIAAIEQCEDFVQRFRDYCAAGREIVDKVLGDANRIRYAQPEAAFYAFLEVEGEHDSMALAERLVREAKVGVAPGMSFGEESDSWLRLCFAQDPETLRTGLERMADTLR
tara:strand:- start:748 stop:1911 length:1164 start_codon:yes stop_codon:yes gene_type:complete